MKNSHRNSDAIAGHLFKVEGAALKATASIGIAFQGFDISNSSSLIARSEKACALARDKGGSSISVINLRDSEGDPEQKLAYMLQDALTNDRFEVMFQPL